MRARRMGWLLLILAAPACGSSGGGEPFTPTTPVADICGMLALSSVQTLVPGASAGATFTVNGNANLWARGCQWDDRISLMIEGALTSQGVQVLSSEIQVTSNANRQVTPVAGLGDEAVYLVNVGLDEILNARKGSYVVSLAAYDSSPPVSETALQPLVVEVLGKL
ncbi:MAG TPA: hypothetical protein VHK47_12960 [Polyangia bacterium]|nr:hypothetical protein [Polyangia bacterium]